MTTNNQYYKTIAEKLTGETITGNHNDNYYLHLIAIAYGYTYNGVICNGRYLKDIAEAVTGNTYTGNHFNNYFLKDMAESLTHETYTNRSDNYLLGVISEYITITEASALFDGIVLSSDKDIISYNGGINPESATLTAQLTYDDSPVAVEGQTVTFEVRKVADDSLVETLTADTDSSGVATVYYLGKGVGDLYVQGICGALLIQTFAIQDIYLYDELTSAKHTWTKSGNNINYSFGNNGLATTGTSGGCYLKLDETLPIDYSFEFEITGISYTSSGVGGGVAIANNFVEFSRTRTGFHNQNTNNLNTVFSIGDIVKLTVINGVCSFYKNDVLIASQSSTVTGFEGFSIRDVNTCGITIKNLKIRQL